MNDELIPLLRNDIHLLLLVDDGHQYVLMTDKLGYASEEIAISVEFYNLMVDIGGKTKYSELSKTLQIDELFIIDQVISNIRNLDEMGFLFSSSFIRKRDIINQKYLELKERPYICSGSSYPEEKEALKQFLNNLFASADIEKYSSDSNAIIVPHIDLKLNEVCPPVYAAGYHSARNTDFDLLVILGTAHYVSSNIFMLTKKNYSTPLGICETDFELIEQWLKNCAIPLDFNEFAHKPEHSIEYQILLSQHYFAGRDYKVLPILVGSFGQFVENGKMPDSSEEFNIMIESLRKSISDLGRKPLFIASVDFAHIGRKFGDDYDAAPTLPNLKLEDRKLIDSIVNIDKKSFFEKIITDCDKYKICGTAPIFSLLSLVDFQRGDFLQYAQWNETETNSAVSFTSIALYK